MRARNVNLTEGTIWKKILIFALPLMLSNVLQQLYNTADLIIVGNYAGTAAQAGVGATGSLVNMLLGFFIGLATGCAVVVAQMHGSDDYDGLYRIVHTAYAVALASGIVLSVAGYFLSSPLLKLMHTPPEVHTEANIYLKIFFAGIVPLLIYNMGAGILRSVGDSRRPFVFLAASAVLNIALDLLFVGSFKWGVAGAGWATVIAQLIAAVLVTLSLTRSDTTYRLYLKDIAFHGQILRKVLLIGVPAGLQSVLIALSNVLIQSGVNKHGENAIAGFATAMRLDGFVFVVINAVALAMMTFSGQNIGARLPERVRRGLYQGILLVAVFAGSLSAILLLLARPIASLFNSDPEVIYYAQRVMFYILLVYWLFGINEVIGGVLRGVGRSVVPMVMTLICMCGVRVFWLYVILPFDPTFDMMMLIYPLSWVITFIIYFIYLKVKVWLPQDKAPVVADV